MSLSTRSSLLEAGMLASTMLSELFTTKALAALATLTHTRKGCLMAINSRMELASAFHGVLTQIT
jgi:hypothetical protein